MLCRVCERASPEFEHNHWNLWWDFFLETNSSSQCKNQFQKTARPSYQALVASGHRARLNRVARVAMQLWQLLQLRLQLDERRTVLGFEGPAPEEDFLERTVKGLGDEGLSFSKTKVFFNKPALCLDNYDPLLL